MDNKNVMSDSSGVPVVLPPQNRVVPPSIPPPQNQGLLLPLPTADNLQNLKEMGCTRNAYKAEELNLAANSHSIIGNLLTGLALLLTAEVGIFSLYNFSKKKCEDGEILDEVAITFTIICLLFSWFTYWQLQEIEGMLSDLQSRQCSLLDAMKDERETMHKVPAHEHTEANNLQVMNNACDSINNPIRLHKLLLFYKVLICILATFATTISMFMGYKSYDMMCG